MIHLIHLLHPRVDHNKLITPPSGAGGLQMRIAPKQLDSDS